MEFAGLGKLSEASFVENGPKGPTQESMGHRTADEKIQGLRPSEAERVEWADLNFERKEVYVKPLGKTGSRRFVLKDIETLWVWLEHVKNKFPNEPLNPTKNHENLQKKIRSDFGGWIQDGLRHRFGTYYHNLIRNIPEVVYVMGNSIGIAKRHYVREVSRELMEKFWSLKPTA